MIWASHWGLEAWEPRNPRISNGGHGWAWLGFALPPMLPGHGSFSASVHRSLAPFEMVRLPPLSRISVHQKVKCCLVWCGGGKSKLGAKEATAHSHSAPAMLLCVCVCVCGKPCLRHHGIMASFMSVIQSVPLVEFRKSQVTPTPHRFVPSDTSPSQCANPDTQDLKLGTNRVVAVPSHQCPLVFSAYQPTLHKDRS